MINLLSTSYFFGPPLYLVSLVLYCSTTSLVSLTMAGSTFYSTTFRYSGFCSSAFLLPPTSEVSSTAICLVMASAVVSLLLAYSLTAYFFTIAGSGANTKDSAALLGVTVLCAWLLSPDRA